MQKEKPPLVKSFDHTFELTDDKKNRKGFVEMDSVFPSVSCDWQTQLFTRGQLCSTNKASKQYSNTESNNVIFNKLYYVTVRTNYFSLDWIYFLFIFFMLG